VILNALRRLRLHLDEPLFRTAWSLIASTLLTATLGLGFWTLAARIYPVNIVGRDSALIASMTAISLLCQLNLNNVIIRFLPQVHHRIGLRVVNAYSLSVSLSLLLGLAFVLLAPSVDSKFTFLRSDSTTATVFILAIAVWSIFTLEDAVLTSLGFATWLPIENGLYSAGKLVLLPLALLFAKDHGVFIAWVMPLLIVVPVINFLIARRVVPYAAKAQRNAPGVVRVFGRRPLIVFLIQDFLGSAAGQIAILGTPLLVLALLGSADSAYFYIPFTLVTTFDLLSLALAVSLTTQAARTPQRIHELTYAVIRRFLFVGLPIIIFIIVAAPLVLLPFGPEYVRHSTTVLRLLAGASCFRSIIYLFSATARLQGQGLRIAVPQITIAIMLISLVILLGLRHGLNGIGVAWLITFSVVALAISPSLVKFLRNPQVPTIPDSDVVADGI
jgi:O-antigen/teichoic acid export membrane protein